MSTLVTFIAGFYALGIIVALTIIIFLIFKRRKLKDKENFEKRDN